MAGASKYAEYNQRVTHFNSHTMPLIDKSINKVKEYRKKYKSEMAGAAKAKSEAASSMARAKARMDACRAQIGQASQDEDVSGLQNELYRAEMLYSQEEERLESAKRELSAAEEGLEKTNARAKDLTERCNTVIQVFQTMIQVIQKELNDRQTAKLRLDQAARTKFGRSAFLESLRVGPEISQDGELIYTCKNSIRELKGKLSDMNGEGEERVRDRGEERENSR